MTSYKAFAIGMLALTSFATSACGQGQGAKNNGKDIAAEETALLPVSYNIYIENSGSVKGYFNPTVRKSPQSANTYVVQLTDRLDERKGDDDMITYNFINTKKESVGTDRNKFLGSAAAKCTAMHSKVDQIIDLCLKGSDENNVDILISDFIFTSGDGGLAVAKSGITKLVSQQLKSKDLAIAILKYDAAFDGKFYPGVGTAINCRQNRPLYMWVFGTNKNVKKVLSLPNLGYEEVAVIQKHQGITPTIKGFAKMAPKNKPGTVIVKNWNADNHKNYNLPFTFNTQNLVYGSDKLNDASLYSLSSDRYSITNISIEGSTCTMTLTTQKPALTTLCISIPNQVPAWVSESSCEITHAIPAAGQTGGFLELVEGIYDAYKNINSTALDITIKLQ